MGLKRLFIDVPVMMESNISACEIKCEYLFHRNNNGQLSLLEVQSFRPIADSAKKHFV